MILSRSSDSRRTNPAQQVCILAVAFLLIAALISPVAARDVRVALHELKPSLFTDDQGMPAGIFVDLIRDIAAKEGWNIIWVHGTFQENLNRLAAGDIDLIIAITDTPEREKIYDFNREAAVATWAQVYAVRGENINTILDLDGKRVAVLKGDINAIAMRDSAIRFNINPTYVERDTLDEIFAETAAGNADVAVASRVAGQESAKKYGLITTPVMFYPNSLGFAVPKGKNQDLLQAIDRYLVKEKGDPSSYYSQTMQKWFGEKAGWVVPPYLWWGLAGIGGLAILFVVISVMFRRQIMNKTAELSQRNEELQSEVTSRARAEAELVRKNEELHAAYEQLTATEEDLRENFQELRKSEQALMQARKKLNLLNTLTSQDIQTGIFSLSGYLQLAKSAGCSGDALVRLSKSEDILRSVRNSLDFSKKYQNLGMSQPKWQNVNYVLINAISHMDFSRISRTVDLDDLEIYADPLLEDVFSILMENILAHGAGATEAGVRYRQNADSVTILVTDNGPGIPKADKEIIFTWEYTGKGGASLFLAREILSITDISLRETGEEGRGARFEITVPEGKYRISATRNSAVYPGPGQETGPGK